MPRKSLKLAAVISAFGTALFLPVFVRAHVGYVINPDAFNKNTGGDFGFFTGALSGAYNLEVVIMGIVLALFGGFLASRISLVQKEIKLIRGRTYSYYEIIPWIIRLSLGIALMGAGTSGVLISPILPFPLFALAEIVVGFLLLAGFLTGPAILATIGLFITALGKDFYMVGNIELLGLAVAMMALGQTWPGVDDLFGIPFGINFRRLESYVPLILRCGIGAAMLYLAWYEKFLNPHVSELVVKEYGFSNMITPALWVLGAGVTETLVGLLLLVGYKTRFAAAVALLVLCVSFFYFQESVYSHVTLFGTLSILFITGGGKLSLDARQGTSG
jgi:uncharacterized membrane protein YphA (DoxX/SURF4 family)